MAFTQTTPRSRLSAPWLIGGILLIVLAIGAAIALSTSRTPAPEAANSANTTSVNRGTIVASVSGSGSIAAAQTLDLAFQANGRVVEVLVEEGDTIKAGQILARLDDRELQLQVSNAEASLQSAQARLAQAEEGNATPEDLAASEAQVRNAEAQLQRTANGNATQADIASAEAALRSAQAKLNELLAGPKAETLASARASVEQAQANVDKAKEGPDESQVISARTTLANAEAAVQQAQAAYDQVKWRNDIGMLPESLQLQQATNNYEQAKANYDNLMSGPDLNDVAIAESQLRNAQEQLAAVSAGPSQAEIASARASVDQAQANLDNLRSGGSQADIAAAQASVDQAQANLARLTAPATETDLAVQRAAVRQAEQALAQAKLSLEDVELRAPFSGIVTAVNIVPGSVVNGPAITLMDRSTLHVDLRLSENDVAQAQLGQPVQLEIDALRNWSAEGEVTYIAPAAETTNDVVTYPIRVSFPGDDAAVKVGMTANLTIVVAEKEDVLLVPNAALLPQGSGHVVQVPTAEGGVREVAVEIGLTDGIQTEIVSGVKEGDQIIALPGSTEDRDFGPFGGSGD